MYTGLKSFKEVYSEKCLFVYDDYRGVSIESMSGLQSRDFVKVGR